MWDFCYICTESQVILPWCDELVWKAKLCIQFLTDTVCDTELYLRPLAYVKIVFECLIDQFNFDKKFNVTKQNKFQI